MAGIAIAGIGALGELVDWMGSPARRESLMDFLPAEHLPWITYGLLFIGFLLLKDVPLSVRRKYLERRQKREERIADIALRKADQRARDEYSRAIVRAFRPGGPEGEPIPRKDGEE